MCQSFGTDDLDILIENKNKCMFIITNTFIADICNVSKQQTHIISIIHANKKEIFFCFQLISNSIIKETFWYKDKKFLLFIFSSDKRYENKLKHFLSVCLDI